MGARRGILGLGSVVSVAVLAAGCLVVEGPTTISSGARGHDVNDAGLVVGSHWLTDPITLQDRAFTYDIATGVTTELGTLELRRAEDLYRRQRVPFLNSATKSVEEMSAVIMQTMKLRGA